MHILTIVLAILFGHCISCVDALNTTIDNTSPLIVFSPTPCFQQDTPGCSPEWQFSESSDDYNGSTTSTTGPDAALGLTVVPRASLVFQGSSIIFVPGQQSTAQATVVVDNLSSILVDTAQNAFSGTGLDPFSNHTITVTFVPSNTPTILEVDYFVVEQPDVNVTTTSVAASTLVPTPLPTVLPSTTIAPPFTHHQPTQSQSEASSSPGVIPTGTIAAVTVCAAILVFLAGLVLFLAVRRRRRRAALQREKAILCDLRLPSEIAGGSNNNNRGAGGRASFSDRRRRSSLSRVWRWGEEQRERRQREMQMQTHMESEEVPWNDADAQQRRDEKGKGRERTWRDSVLPPVHYTPWQ